MDIHKLDDVVIDSKTSLMHDLEDRVHSKVDEEYTTLKGLRQMVWSAQSIILTQLFLIAIYTTIFFSILDSQQRRCPGELLYSLYTFIFSPKPFIYGVI
jgi:hypothetical protein